MRQFVRVLMAGPGNLQPTQFLVHVVVAVALDERQIVVVRMPAMAEADPCHELVRFGYLVDGLEIAASIDKGESLPRAVGPLGDNRHVVGRPGSAPRSVRMRQRGGTPSSKTSTATKPWPVSIRRMSAPCP